MARHLARHLDLDTDEFVFHGRGTPGGPPNKEQDEIGVPWRDAADLAARLDLPSVSMSWLSTLANDKTPDDEAAYAKPEHAQGKGKSDSDGPGNGKGGGRKDKNTGGDETDDGSSGGSDGDSGSGGDGSGDGGSDPVQSAEYVSGLDNPDGFNIALNFSGGWTDALKNAVYQVAEHISDVITGDLPDINGIDDILIDMRLTTIDGSGGYAGRATYTALRPDSQIPYSGYVEMDSADAEKLLSNGIFDELVQHEMLHALGMGTVWNSMGLVETIDGAPRFTGEQAIVAYNDIFASAGEDPLSHKGVPLSPDGFHWNEGVIGKEAMTPRIGSSDNITDLTLAALEDMGYDTIYGDDLLVA